MSQNHYMLSITLCLLALNSISLFSHNLPADTETLCEKFKADNESSFSDGKHIRAVPSHYIRLRKEWQDYDRAGNPANAPRAIISGNKQSNPRHVAGLIAAQTPRKILSLSVGTNIHLTIDEQFDKVTGIIDDEGTEATIILDISSLQSSGSSQQQKHEARKRINHLVSSYAHLPIVFVAANTQRDIVDLQSCPEDNRLHLGKPSTYGRCLTLANRMRDYIPVAKLSRELNDAVEASTNLEHQNLDRATEYLYHTHTRGERLVNHLKEVGIGKCRIPGRIGACEAEICSYVHQAYNLANGQGAKSTHYRHLLLDGPPGTGKTTLAVSLAAMLNAQIMTLSAPRIVSAYIGSGAKKVHETISAAKESAKNQPVVIFVDELDAIAMSIERKGSDGGREYENTVEEFWTSIDEIKQYNSRLAKGTQTGHPIFIICATNHKNKLDKTLLGRFSKQITIDNPDLETRQEIIESFFVNDREIPLTNSEIKSLAKKSKGLSVRGLENVADETKDLCDQDIPPSVKTITQLMKKEQKGTTAPTESWLTWNKLQTPVIVTSGALAGIYTTIRIEKETGVGAKTAEKIKTFGLAGYRKWLSKKQDGNSQTESTQESATAKPA